MSSFRPQGDPENSRVPFIFVACRLNSYNTTQVMNIPAGSANPLTIQRSWHRQHPGW